VTKTLQEPEGPGARRQQVIVASLLLLRVIVLGTVVVGVPHFPTAEASRFWEIAHAQGTPYRTFPVEYSIVEVGLIKAIASGDLTFASAALAVVAFAADMVAFIAVRARAGMSAAARYLYLGTPLLIFIYRRSDLLSVALATTAAAFVTARRQRTGGAALGVAILTKLWPIVVAPALLVRGRSRAVPWLVGTCAVGALWWAMVGGLAGPWEVISFRGATGWEIESSVGTVVWTLTGERRFEEGAFRTGTITSVEKGILLAALVALLWIIWSRAARSSEDEWGVPAATAVAALLVLSPLLSPQYAAWLLPWVAMSKARRFRWVAAIPVILTGAAVCVWYLDIWRGHPGLTQVLLIARNAALLATVVYGVALLPPVGRERWRGATRFERSTG
jgi:hypothetical protein